MKADPKRKPGFYWVRFEGLVIVAEYAKAARGGFRDRWIVPGSVTAFEDGEVCELLSERLEPPREKKR